MLLLYNQLNCAMKLLLNNKNFSLVKIGSISRQKIKMAGLAEFVHDGTITVENFVGKREIAGYQHFLLFP